ncbi:MAG: hypothetical protein ACTSRP_09190 [Candidatus Helarchaeota archaeon]
MVGKRLVSFKFSEALINKIKKRSRELNLTMSDYIRDLIYNDLNDYKSIVIEKYDETNEIIEMLKQENELLRKEIELMKTEITKIMKKLKVI